MAAVAATGLPRARAARPAAADRRRRQRPGAHAPGRRRRPPPARLAPRRQPARDRMEALGPARHPGGARVRGAAGRRRGTGLGRAAGPARGGADPAPGALGRRGRARPASLSPGAAGTASARPGRRRPAPPCLPARAGAAACGGGCMMARRRRRHSPQLDASSRRWSLAAAGACLLPLLLQLPGNVAGPVGGLGILAVLLSWRTRLPAWPRPLLALTLFGLVLVNYGFHFGRDTGCALLAAMLAIKPMELRNLRDAAACSASPCSHRSPPSCSTRGRCRCCWGSPDRCWR